MQRAAQDPPRWLGLAASLLSFVLASCATPQVDDASGAGPAPEDPGVVHIHGLGINPADGDLYAATHMGVFRISEHGRATRMGDSYQDTMGFIVVGLDHFLASGHPDLRDDLPPLLGLIESRDGGVTWEPKSLLGEADFHALRYVHETIYGYDSTGEALMVSGDGVRWDTRSTAAMYDFAVAPDDPEHILATLTDGLARSTDGGRSWERIDGPSRPVFLDWGAAQRVWLLDAAGQLHMSADGGVSWESRGEVLGRPEALLAAAGELYAATEDGIFVSADDGHTWEVYYSEDGDH